MKFLRSITFIPGLIVLGSSFANASDFKSLVEAQLDAPIKTADPAAYSYVISIDIDSREGSDEAEIIDVQYRYNPAAQAGERVALMGTSWEDLPKDMRRELQKSNNAAEPDDDLWCLNSREDLEVMASDDVTVIREDENEAVVSLSPDGVAQFLADDDEDGRDMPKKIRKRMLSELTFSKPDLYLTNSRIWLSEPTSVKIIAKMKEMEFLSQCAPGPNGMPHVTTANSYVKGKALGTAFEARVNISISDLRPAAETP